jgi:hypothetical protein
MRRVDDRGLWGRDPGHARDCAGLRAVSVDYVRAQLAQRSYKADRSGEIRPGRHRAPEIQAKACGYVDDPVGRLGPAQDNLIPPFGKAIGEVANMASHSSVGRLMDEQDASHARTRIIPSWSRRRYTLRDGESPRSDPRRTT